MLLHVACSAAIRFLDPNDWHGAPSCQVCCAGAEGLGAIFQRIPPLLWARPRQTDKWDLRIVQLAAFHHTHSHCRVPPVWCSGLLNGHHGFGFFRFNIHLLGAEDDHPVALNLESCLCLGVAFVWELRVVHLAVFHHTLFHCRAPPV